MPSLTLDIDYKSELHERILDACRVRIQASKAAYQEKYTKWREAEDRAIAFMPERNVDALRRSKREQGSPQYTTIQIPYTYSVLMASHTYWTTVFLSRTPVFQFDGRHGEAQQNVLALEAIVNYQQQVGQMLVPLYIWLYDVGKYGVGVLGNYWDEQFTTVSNIVEKEEMLFGLLKTGRTKKSKVTKRVLGYQGNKVYNFRPFDFFPDPRVPLWDFQSGEFCAVYRRFSWNQLLKRAALGYLIKDNIDRVRPGSEPPDSNRVEGSSRLELPRNDTFLLNREAKNNSGKTTESSFVPGYEVFIDLVPNEWGLGGSDMPEKWVFTIDAWAMTVLGAQPFGANHDKFPFCVTVLEPEGYSLAPRGMPEILEPVQNTMDWLINSHFYNVRKILNGQFIVDPSRIVVSDMLDPVPGGIIRAKAAAYGSDIRTAVSQLNAVDVTTNHLRDLQVIQHIGERAVGVNDQLMGSMMQGGRRTAQEVRSANTFGISRLKTNAEVFSAQGFAPLGTMLVQNTQQYYTGEQKFRIAGDLMRDATEQFQTVTPEDIAGFYDFVPVDGTLPIDRFAQANLWRELFIGLRSMPEVAGQYDVGKIFEWIAQLGGLKNLNRFKIQTQVVPDAQLAAQVQAGNVVPMAKPGSSGPDQTGIPQPGQLPGMGQAG